MRTLYHSYPVLTIRHTAHLKNLMIFFPFLQTALVSLIFLISPRWRFGCVQGRWRLVKKNGSRTPSREGHPRRPFHSYGDAPRRIVIVSRPHVVIVRIGLPLVFTIEKLLTYDVLAVGHGSPTQVRPLYTFCPCRDRSLGGPFTGWRLRNKAWSPFTHTGRVPQIMQEKWPTYLSARKMDLRPSNGDLTDS